MVIGARLRDPAAARRFPGAPVALLDTLRVLRLGAPHLEGGACFGDRHVPERERDQRDEAHGEHADGGRVMPAAHVDRSRA
jgi:hypothetical protein